jgi:TonB-linked SusC/RagA family outer membrane protein
MRNRISISLLLFISITHASIAQDGNNEVLRRTFVQLKQTHWELPKLFKEIQRQSGLLFVYQPIPVERYKNVSVPIIRLSVAEALDSALRQTHLGYEESNRNIIVFRKPDIHTIKGEILDQISNEPIPGASIKTKFDSSKVTISNEEGLFEITVADYDIVIFSSSGRTVRQIPANAFFQKSGTVFKTVYLEPLVLDEVLINTGYYTLTNEELVGNISSVTSKEIARSPVLNPLQAMQARNPGVYIEQLTGVPGGGFKIRIRGRNSLRENGNDPLYEVDGVPYPAQSIASSVGSQVIPLSNPLSLLSPALIDRIDVLKDADATAIYGSRGANGVVLISTQKAERKVAGAEASFHSGFSAVAQPIKLLNSKQWLEMRREAFKNDQVTATNANAPDLLVWDTTRYTDWQKELIGGIAPVTNATVSLFGGEERTKFLFTGSMARQGTVFPGSFDYLRFAGLFNLNYHSKDNRFQSTITINYSRDRNELPTIDLASKAVTLSPVAPALYDSHNQLNWDDEWINPLSLVQKPYTAKTSNVLASTTLSYELLPKFVIKTRMGLTNIDKNEMGLDPVSSYSPQQIATGITGTNTTSTSTLDTWIVEPQLEYTYTLGQGTLQFLSGMTLQQSVTHANTTIGYGYPNDALIENIASAPYQEIKDPVYSKYKYSAGYGRINYTWREKYIVNLTGRRDGSTRFGTGNQFANFGAVGAAWIITKEPFTDYIHFISFAKLRASYGTTGSDQIGDYGFYQTYAAGQFGYQGGTFYPTRIANAMYSWEASTKLETALDIAFWRNRIHLELAWYRNETGNQLTGRNVPSTTGFRNIQYNMPITVRNTGVELILSTTQIDTESLHWSTSMNLTIPRNKLVKYDNLDGSNDAQQYAIGQSIELIKRQHTTIDPLTGNFLLGELVTKPRGVTLFGGIDNTIRFHNFELNVLLQFVKQVKESYQSLFYPPGSNVSNQPVEVMERWQKEGDTALGHRFTQNGAGYKEYSNGVNYGDVAYADASFIRLKNVALSYNIGATLLKKTPVQSLRINLQAQNLLTFTEYFTDPESLNPDTLPPLRTIVGGIQLTL